MSKYDQFDTILKPLGTELLEKLSLFPVTIVYINSLETVGYCYQYVSSVLGESQYIPKEEKTPENRIFGQYHRQYTSRMKEYLVGELRKDVPKVRLIFATVALGMGLDSPSIERVIHLQPPTSLEKYMQEIGRAGRQGHPASARLHFSNRDISKCRKGMTDAMRSYCSARLCLRQKLVSYFGFDEVLYAGPCNRCCSNCYGAL